MYAWNPTVTASKITDGRSYHYGASIVEVARNTGRVFCCVGRGSDTISSVLTTGKGAEGWELPGKLVADPCAVRYGNQLLLAYTVGDLNGERNGVGFHWMTGPTMSTHGRHDMLLAQSVGHPNSRYGTGQPAIAARPYSPTIIVTTTTVSGVNRLQAHYLDVSGHGGLVRIGQPIQILGGDDGVSVEAIWLSPTRLCMVQPNGANMITTRTYQMVGGQLIRETCETAREGISGRTFTRFDNVIDGAGIVRDAGNQPVYTTAGGYQIWIATGNRSNPGSWALHKTSIAVPT